MAVSVSTTFLLASSQLRLTKWIGSAVQASAKANAANGKAINMVFAVDIPAS